VFRLALHWQILICMIAGALLGIALNTSAGQSSVTLDDGLPNGYRRIEIIDTASRTEFRLEKEDQSQQTIVIAQSNDEIADFHNFEDFAKTHSNLHSLYLNRGQSPAHYWGAWFKRIGNLFLRLLKMVAVPLIVCSLISGIMGLGGAGRVGWMFYRTLSYYLITSLLAILTGIVLVNWIEPGLTGGEGPAKIVTSSSQSAALGETIFNQIEAMLPDNPAAALVKPDFLSIIAFTLAFSIFALRLGGATADSVRRTANIGLDVIMAMTTAIIRLAPIGVFFLMMYVTSTQGLSVFRSLGYYMLTVALGLLFHSVVTLPLIVWFVAKRNPLQFAKAMAPALLTAFSSASSNGTLPLTMTSIEKRAGVSNRTASFVLPLGATINMDGTALYEAVAVLFIAQVHYGHDLELSQQLIVAFTALLASVGAAGIPHAGLVMMVIILQAVNLPVEMQGIILAVDRVLDMGRTSVNVWSDCCGCAVVEAYESPDSNSAPSATGS
jgi:proton glutamate symport protein